MWLLRKRNNLFLCGYMNDFKVETVEELSPSTPFDKLSAGAQDES